MLRSFSLVIFLGLTMVILACAPHTPNQEVETYEQKSDCTVPSVATTLCNGCLAPTSKSTAEVNCKENYKITFKDSMGTEITTTGEKMYCTTKMRWAVYIQYTVPTFFDINEIKDVQCKLPK